MATKADGSPFDPWIQLHHSIVKCPAYRSLKPNSRALLIELMTGHEGYNNGFISLSYRQAAEALIIGINQAKAAFDDLRAKGFIIMTYKGKRISNAERIASKWEVTAFDGFDSSGNPRPATKDFLKWTAEDQIKPDDVKTIEEIDRKKQNRKSRSKNIDTLDACQVDTSAELCLDKYMNDLLTREDPEEIPF